jgi:hypothetical protein
MGELLTSPSGCSAAPTRRRFDSDTLLLTLAAPPSPLVSLVLGFRPKLQLPGSLTDSCSTPTGILSLR